MFPDRNLLPRHHTRPGALTLLELGDPGLGGGEPQAKVRDQPLELGHRLLEVPELAAGWTRRALVRTLDQVAVFTRHQQRVLEVTLKVNTDRNTEERD